MLAVMRLSPNPVLQVGGVGLPVDLPRHAGVRAAGVLGAVHDDLPAHRARHPVRPAVRPPQHPELSTPRSVSAVIGLGLNEAAYMAEIVRAGISSVGEGQTEASTALGMSWGLTMRRIVLPQAMRVIIPPTGNEVISMLKTTSLVTAVPFSTRPVRPATRDISGVELPADPAAAGRGDLVPADHQHPDDRPVLPGAVLRPRRRRAS